MDIKREILLLGFESYEQSHESDIVKGVSTEDALVFIEDFLQRTGLKTTAKKLLIADSRGKVRVLTNKLI